MLLEVDKMNINEIVQALKSLQVHAIKTSSKDIESGDAFLCIMGQKVDRHDYIEDAVKRGASAIIASKVVETTVPVFYLDNINDQQYALLQAFYENPQKKITMIGVTGTDGKTSTATILYSLLYPFQDCGYMGTNGIYSKDIELPAANTTPSYETLLHALSTFIKHDVPTVAMEVSSEGIYANRIKDLLFDVAIFTNLSPEHLNTHHTMEAYFKEKAKLFDQIKEHGIAIINGDDVYGKQIKSPENIIYYGQDSSNDVQIVDLDCRQDGLSFKLQTKDNLYSIETNLIGAFNAYNLTAALITCMHLGIDIKDLIQPMKHLFIKGRMNRITLGQAFEVIIDYAHTPNGLRQLFETINESKKGKSIVVIGSAGGRDVYKRPEMGQIVASMNDYVVFTQEDPRFEDPQDIINAMVSKIETNNYDIVVDRYEAIEHALKMASPGDVVMILGKGQENYQMIQDKKITFNDYDVACEIIKGLVN